MNRAASPRVSSKAPGPPVGAITRASLQEKSGSPGLAIFALSRLKGRRGRCLPFRRHAFLQLRPQQGERPIARADYGRPRADLTLSARAFGRSDERAPGKPAALWRRPYLQWDSSTNKFEDLNEKYTDLELNLALCEAQHYH